MTRWLDFVDFIFSVFSFAFASFLSILSLICQVTLVRFVVCFYRVTYLRWVLSLLAYNYVIVSPPFLSRQTGQSTQRL